MLKAQVGAAAKVDAGDIRGISLEPKAMSQVLLTGSHVSS